MNQEQTTIANARAHLAEAQNRESRGRRERVDDMAFVKLGRQWPDAVRRDRERPGAERPMLTSNRLLTFCNNVINDIRQNRPAIKVRPIDDQADVEVATILQGLIGHIHNQSNADIALDTATEWQVITGLGYFRVLTAYSEPDSFDQEIVIKAIADPNQVFFDPDSVEPDGSDARFALIVEEMSREAFEGAFPGLNCQGWQPVPGWFDRERVRVAEYFVIETTERVLALLESGETVWKDELTHSHGSIVRERTAALCACHWYKIAGDRIIDEAVLPTSFIPIIPVYGQTLWLEGQKHVSGLVRHAKDPARLYNYMLSASVETLALAPKSPFIAAAGQTDGFEELWLSANTLNHPVLLYNPVSDQGQICPPPRREAPPPVNPGFEAAMARSLDDMKATMGIFDASLGNRESEQSGRAILSQQRQASIGNFHFSDNLSRSIKHLGRILVQMIPKVYDSSRVLRITGADGRLQRVALNPGQRLAKMVDSDGLGLLYNLGVGKYDVVVDSGPSYATQRQEASEAMLGLVRAYPGILPIAGDLIVGNMDWPGAREIADRLAAMLPAQVQGENRGV